MLGILIAYIVVLAVVYAGGVFYYSGHFYPGSKINGLAPERLEEVERDIEGHIASYELVIFRSGRTRRKVLQHPKSG